MAVIKQPTLLAGYSPEGICYNFFAMPFFESACIELENRSDKTIDMPWIAIKKASMDYYNKQDYG